MEDAYKRFIRSVVKGGGQIPEVLFRQMYAQAPDSGGLVSLATLAARPDVPDDLDAVFRDHSDLDVRLAWASRPGRSTAEIIDAFANETRVRALAALAALDLPDGGHMELLERCPKFKVATTILQNEEVNDDVKVAAAAVAVKTHPDRKPSREFINLVTRSAACLEAAWQHATSPMLLIGLAARHQVPASKVNAVVTAVTRTIPSRDFSVEQSAIDALDRVEFRAVDRALLNGLVNAINARIQSLRGPGNYYTARLAAILVKIETILTGTAPATAGLDELVDLIAQAATTDDGQLAFECATNPACTGEHLARAVRAVPRARIPELVGIRPADVIAIMKNAKRVGAAELVQCMSHVPDPETTIDELLACGAVEHGTVACTTWMTRERVLNLRAYKLEQMSLLPETAQAIVLDEIAVRLGTDTARWSLFEALLGDWPGGLDELLDTIDVTLSSAT